MKDKIKKTKKSDYPSVRDQLKKFGFNPVEAMIEIAVDKSHPVSVRRSAIKDLLDKTFPDLKAVEMKTDEDISESIKEARDMMMKLLDSHTKDF
jgi:hypothetical protein